MGVCLPNRATSRRRSEGWLFARKKEAHGPDGAALWCAGRGTPKRERSAWVKVWGVGVGVVDAGVRAQLPRTSACQHKRACAHTPPHLYCKIRRREARFIEACVGCGNGEGEEGNQEGCMGFPSRGESHVGLIAPLDPHVAHTLVPHSQHEQESTRNNDRPKHRHPSYVQIYTATHRPTTRTPADC